MLMLLQLSFTAGSLRLTCGTRQNGIEIRPDKVWLSRWQVHAYIIPVGSIGFVQEGVPARNGQLDEQYFNLERGSLTSTWAGT